MSLKFMYITNDPAIALAAEKSGVDRIWIDLEIRGKELRQQNLNTVISHHSVADIRAIADVLTTAELMVRINPWNEESEQEVETVIAAGAERIMLPMWTTPEEVASFLAAVDKRAATTLLLETRQAVECLDAVLENPLVEEIHIGLNDLHLSYGQHFMFEPLGDGTVEALCRKIAKKGIPYGFGGIARIGEGMLPAERILCEHVRLQSSVVILSRSFFDPTQPRNHANIEAVFAEELEKIRAYERTYAEYNDARIQARRNETCAIISEIAARQRKAHEEACT